MTARGSSGDRWRGDRWRGDRWRRYLVPGAAATGVVAAMTTTRLPWTDPELWLPIPVRLIMATAGAALLILVGRPWVPPGPTARGAALLGLAVTAYPTLLTVAAANIGGAPVGVLAAAGHVPALMLVQLVPVLACAEVTGRSRRVWAITIVAVAAVGFGLTGAAVAGAPGAAVWATISTGLWFASFALSPIATWTAVRGTAGETRRRAVVAGLASVLPVAIIVWCLALGRVGETLGFAVDGMTTALMIGFAVATTAGGALAVVALGPGDSVLLRTRFVVTTMNLLIGFVALTVVAVLAVAIGDDGTGARGAHAGWALLAGVATAVVLGLPWLRWQAWTGRVVDPAAELRHELATVGATDGAYRHTAQAMMRRLLDDPALRLWFAVDTHRWAGADGTVRKLVPPQDAVPGEVVVARGADGTPSVLGEPGTDAAGSRLSRLGDCTPLLREALLEARVDHESRRAQQAGAQERRRLTQNLHDGLQGRLLGLALHIQLAGRSVDDPAARLVMEETVGALRDMVEDVRVLGGGDLPELLVRDGLGPALTALFRPAAGLVDLDVPHGRLAPGIEATVYFVVGEAVTNALKHAGAGRIRVSVEQAEGRVSVRVRDDGGGGADPRLGSGLRGLSERVTAEGGVLVVREEVPRGTVVEAVLPCG